MQSVSAFYTFMKKREQIRLNREVGLPWPWTSDLILREFKFTNVRRAHDRTTRELKAEFYDLHQNASPKLQFLNCAIFRYFGTIEFARAIGWQNGFYPDYIKDVAARRFRAKERVFTGAYIVPSLGIRAPKQEVVVDIVLADLWKQAPAILAQTKKTQRWQTMIEEMRKVRGFWGSGFMAKEVVLDTMFTNVWAILPKDLNTWCPAGPGARRGINRVLGRDIYSPLSEEFILERMLELFERRATYWPADWIKLELHDIQFQLCEFDKYERFRLNQGRPRSRYHPA